MTDIEFEPTEATDPDDLELPSRLPVLPLKETVVFPDSATPLAIGQERSIKLIDDVVARDRLLALVTVKSEDVEQPGWDDLYGVWSASGSRAGYRTIRTSSGSSSRCPTSRRKRLSSKP